MFEPTSKDFWRAIILYGSNMSTYKMGLGHLLINYANKNLVCEQINLGSSTPVSNKELLDTIQKHTGKMNIVIRDGRPGDPAYLVANISKAKKILNWFPEQSSIDNIVATAVKWYNKLNKKNMQ